MTTKRFPLLSLAMTLGVALIFPSTAAAAPANTVSPTISGTAKLGGKLTANKGTWTAPEGFAYQWFRCDTDAGAAGVVPGDCATITGATSRVVTVRSADAGKFLLVRVTSGATVATSATTTEIVGIPALDTAPVPDNGADDLDGEVGDTFTIDGNTWTYATPTSYRWYRCTKIATTNTTPTASAKKPSDCSVIADDGANGATSDTYVSDPDLDGGKFLRVRVGAQNTAGARYVFSKSTTKLEFAPVASKAPSIGGSLRVGGIVKASTGTWSGYSTTAPTAITYTYQWLSCLVQVEEASDNVPAAGYGCEEIPDADESQFEVTDGEQGTFLVVVVTATNGIGSNTYWSASTSRFVPIIN